MSDLEVTANILTTGVPSPWIDVEDYASFIAAIDAIGATERTLLIASEKAVADDKTVPSNITLKFLQGGSLNIANTKTVTINGHIEAELYQIFKGDGSVSFGTGSVKEVYPQWWGAEADDSNDDISAIQAATDSWPTGGIVFFPKGIYKISILIDVPNNDYQYVFQGTGTQTSIIHYTGTDKAVDARGTVTDRCFLKMKDIQVKGENDAGNAADGIVSAYGWRHTILKNVLIQYFKGGAGLLLNHSQQNQFYSVISKYNKYGLYAGGGASDYINAVGFFGCSFENNVTHNVYLEDSGGVGFHSSTIQGLTAGTYGTLLNGKNRNVLFSGCYLEEPISGGSAVVTVGLSGTSYAEPCGDITFINTRIIQAHVASSYAVHLNNYVMRVSFINCGIQGVDYAVYVPGANLAHVWGIEFTGNTTIIGTVTNPQATAPTEGKWIVGEKMYTWAPSAGNPPGWACINRQDTQMRVQANAGDTIMEVDATAGMLATDVIGVTLDDDTIHWSTISAITDGDTLVLDDVIPAGRNAPVNANIFTNRWKAMARLDLQGSDTWDPASIAAGAEEAKEVTVTGAALGDFVVASFSLDLLDLVLNAQVTAANTVTAILANNTGGAIDLGSGTIRAKVIKK